MRFLELYGMNSINLLVDLSNYVMITTGHPSHLLDQDKMTGSLRWNLNEKYSQITTLDGTKIDLAKNQEVILEDDKNILALAGLVGGKKAALSDSSQNIIAEMAIYDHATVRKNARDLRVITEAGTRLSKDLDAEGMSYAFELLLTLIMKYAQGKPGAWLSYYPKKRTLPIIEMDWEAPKKYAGIEIGKKDIVKYLKNIRFAVKESAKGVSVKPPEDRTDINIMEDVVEEVVRMADFRNIPQDKIPALNIAKEITPENIKNAKQAQDILSANGFDEIMSLPLVQEGENARTNYLPWQELITQNAVNEEYPALRQTLAVGLLNQLEEYKKKDIPAKETLFFEIGKVFGLENEKYKEHDALAVIATAFESLAEFRQIALEKFLRSMGITEINYQKDEVGAVAIANPKNFWRIIADKKEIGVIYKLRPRKNATYFFEINLLELSNILKKTKVESTEELTEKIITLDANKELGKERKYLEEFLSKVKTDIGEKNLWSMKVFDKYEAKEKIKYTIRVSYKKLSDQEAKKLHLKVFGLKSNN